MTDMLPVEQRHRDAAAALFGISKTPESWDCSGIVQAFALFEHDHLAPLIAAAVAAERERCARAARFLLDRLEEIDWSLDKDEIERDFHGHVAPAIARLTVAIRAQPAEQPHTGADAAESEQEVGR